MTESPALHTPDLVAPLSPNSVSEPLSHTQRRAVLIVTFMAILIALACGIAGYMVGFRAGLAQVPMDSGALGTTPTMPLDVSPLPSAGGPHMACTQEAKICPDGSSVGRSGPNCEFAPCPGETAPPASGVQKY